MHCLDQDGHAIGIDIRRNPVAEIEDVTRTPAITLQYVGHSLFDFGGR
jgi:hypothetical protein